MPEVLDEQELGVSLDLATHDRVGEKRPHHVTVEFNQTGVDRPGHPFLKARIPGEERAGRCLAFTTIGRLSTKLIGELNEVFKEPDRC